MIKTLRFLFSVILLVAGGGLFSLATTNYASAAASEIGYIRKEIPEFNIPPYRGERYETVVPDTLDLAERAELAINGLTGITDPEADHENYWVFSIRDNCVIMQRDFNAWIQPKYMEDLPLLRIITGSDLNDHVERTWIEVFLHMIGPDGLAYMPVEGRPWGTPQQSAAGMVVWRADGTTTSPDDKDVTQMCHPSMWNGRMLGAATIYYLRDKDPLWRQTVEQIIQRLSELVIDKGNYSYFPAGFFEPNAQLPPDAEAPKGAKGASSGASIWLIQALAQYYKVTGYEPARVLAGKLITYLKDHSEYFDTEGRYLSDPGNVASYMNEYDRYLDIEGRFVGGPHREGTKYFLSYADSRSTTIDRRLINSHFHRHTYGLLAMLDHALATGDRELMEFVRKGYEYGRANGSALIGFFPENIAPDYPTAETCEIADMIALALKLTEAEVGDYWDDVDRWVRNQFAENQLMPGPWMERYGNTEAEVGPDEYADPGGKRVVGTFAGWPSVVGWASHKPYITPNLGTMHCCIGNGARTIYYVWKNILDYTDGQLRVNLLLNRASSWADVESHIPYKGRVDLKIKKPCSTVLVRVPEWLESGSREVASTVNGASRAVQWEGRYVNLGAAQPKDIFTVNFPIWERTVREVIGGIPYTLIIKGNTVVQVDPPAEEIPLYEGEQSRTAQTSRTRITRFAHAAWAEVDSYMPSQGRIDLRIKQPTPKVLVQLPKWIERGSSEVACTVNAKPREVQWEGRYINLGAAQPKDTFTLTFPIGSERSAGQVTDGIPYTVVIRKPSRYFAKGNNMINVDAPGEAIPLYQRDHYRRNQAPTKQVIRFVSEEDIRW